MAAEKGNKRLYKSIIMILLLVAILIGLVLFYQKKTEPIKDVTAVVPQGITHIRSIYGPKGGDNFDKPESVGFDKDGNIYVADTGNHRIVIFDNSGNFIRMFGDIKTTPFPLGIAVAETGNIYVTSLMFQRFIILDSKGKVKRKMVFKKKEDIPLRVIINDNKLYITTVGHVLIADMNGNIKKKFAKEGRALGMLEYPNGIAYGTKGDIKNKIIVSDSNNNRLQVFTKTGKPFAYIGRPPKSLKDTGLLFGLPTGITLDDEERIYVADALNHNIRVIANTGEQYAEFGDMGSTDGMFYYPTDIKYIGGKRFIVTDKWNDRLQIVDLTLGSKPNPPKPNQGL